MKNRFIFLCVVAGAIALACVAVAPRMLARASALKQILSGGIQTLPSSSQDAADAEAKRVAAQISAYAAAKCGAENPALDCEANALWTATQCPELLQSSAGAAAGSRPCDAAGPGFVFDVASIKEYKDDGNGWIFTSSGERADGVSRVVTSLDDQADGSSATNMTVKNMIFIACRSDIHAEMTGDPSWTGEARYDVKTKYTPEVADALKKLSPDDRQVARRYMLLMLLKERMNLAVHYTSKEVPSYDLVIGKNGPKLKEADPTAKGNGNMQVQMNQKMIEMTAKGMTLKYVVGNISRNTGRPVFDKTGLTGIYDFKLQYAPAQTLSAAAPGGSMSGGPDMPAGPMGPSIMDAVAQLGLKLVASHVPIQVIVIDHVERPSPN